MAAKGNFFSKFISFFLIVIIISGVGFLGYNIISGNGGMNMSSMGSMTTAKDNKTDTKENANTTDNSSKDNMNMGNSANNTDSNTNNNNSSTQYATTVINTILQNKDNVEKVNLALKDTLKLMTLDPYGIEKRKENNNSSDTKTQQNGQNQTTTQEGTTVNVYTQNSTNTTMENMGTTYDTDKMEKLHTGLYKVSIGMQLLDQLKNNLSFQLEQASLEVKDPSQYYYDQYLITVQNKTKLTEALGYINEASSLVNINPYVSQNGAVYDKDRMTSIHESIYKLAQVVIDLNKVNDNFSNQAITLGNVTQNYINNNGQSMQGMNMNGTGFNIFGNINMITVFNVLVVVFIVIFIISILGYISRLLKSPRNTN